MSKHEIYLEIGSRQCGKTERLISAVINHINLNDNPPIVVCSSKSRIKYLRSKIVEPLYYAEVAYMVPSDFNLEASNYIRSNSNLRVFYDEFDFFDNRKIYLDPNGYYVTTSNVLRTPEDMVLHHYGFRDDMMLDLLKLTKGRYEAYTSYPSMDIDSLVNISRCLSDKSFSNEYGQTLFERSS